MRTGCGVCGALLTVLLANQSLAWKDLSEEFVLKQVEIIKDSSTTATRRQEAAWALVSAGRAPVNLLEQVARKHPELAWDAVGLLDLIRTDNQVVKIFSEFLDSPPDGLRSTGEVQGFLSSRLEDMLGRKFKDGDERRAWVKENADTLAYDPAAFRYRSARSDHPGLDRAFGRLIMALHLGREEVLRTLVGPEVKIVRAGGKQDTVPVLDIDAFADPPSNHRAVSFRDEGKGRWLVRTIDAYFFFEGENPICVKAGLKPIE